MSAAILRRAAIAPNTGVDALSVQSLGAYSPGARILVKSRFQQRTFDATSAPADSAQEGPYVRVYPVTGDLVGRTQSENKNWSDPERAMFPKAPFRNTASNTYSDEAGNPIALAPDVSDDFMYEFDAQGGSFYLPFPASLSLYTGYCGSFVYEVFAFAAEPPKDEQHCYQTRVCRAGRNRDLAIPTGASEFRVITNGAWTGELWTEETGKAAAGGTSIFPLIGAAGQYWPVPVGNARKVRISPVNDAVCVFKIRFP